MLNHSKDHVYMAVLGKGKRRGCQNNELSLLLPITYSKCFPGTDINLFGRLLGQSLDHPTN